MVTGVRPLHTKVVVPICTYMYVHAGEWEGRLKSCNTRKRSVVRTCN